MFSRFLASMPATHISRDFIFLVDRINSDIFVNELKCDFIYSFSLDLFFVAETSRQKKEFSCWYRLVRFKIFHKKCQEIILINNIQSNSIFRRERAIGHENNVQKPAVVLPVALSECNSRKIYRLFSYIVGHNNMPRGYEN